MDNFDEDDLYRSADSRPVLRSLMFAILGGIALGVTGCTGGEQGDTEPVGRTDQALTPTQPFVRPNIYDFGPSQRATLVNGILDFITQPIIDEHAQAHDWHHPGVGELFFIRHHEYLDQLEDYLLGHGLSGFVPVPEWDPVTAIPAEFLVADPLVTQAPMNANPNPPIHPEFADTELCKFATASDMAKAVEEWHDGVHTAVGGAMFLRETAAGAPIFWLWHGFLDDMYHERTWRCETLPALVVATRE